MRAAVLDRPLVQPRARLYGYAAPVALAVSAIVVFAAFSLWQLDRLPPVYEDEPWQASAAYKLATQGSFASDMFAGWHGMERRYYDFMPIHPFILAGVYRVFGEGLLQTRVEAVVMTCMSLGLTAVLGWRLFGAWVGSLAVIILLLVRWTGTTYIQLTGIPVFDLARIARYDVVVPVFALLALLVYLSARERGGWRYGLAGFLVGLAGLSHLYGVFWVAVLGALILWDGAREGRLRALVWLASGFLLPWLPYLVYVLTGLDEWRMQTRIYGDRFGLLDLRWYLANLLDEPHRYGPGLGPFGLGWLLRPGWWTMLLLVPASVFALAWRAVRKRDRAARVIVASAVIMPVLFALLLRLKLVNYTLTFLPILALAAAWGCLRAAAWLLERRDRKSSLAALGAAAVLTLGVVAEGGRSMLHFAAQASTTTPYMTFIQQVRDGIPSGSRVLGLHNYWFGFEDTQYRALIVALDWMDPQTENLTFQQALDQVDPDYLLLDARMRAFFDQSPDTRLDLEGWLQDRQARLVREVDDPTYGKMQVYAVNRS
jgi:4-amino-4-deoxy-L-arabinose transferase-like glycosyltransferase